MKNNDMSKSLAAVTTESWKNATFWSGCWTLGSQLWYLLVIVGTQSWHESLPICRISSHSEMLFNGESHVDSNRCPLALFPLMLEPPVGTQKLGPIQSVSSIVNHSSWESWDHLLLEADKFSFSPFAPIQVIMYIYHLPSSTQEYNFVVRSMHDHQMVLSLCDRWQFMGECVMVKLLGPFSNERKAISRWDKQTSYGHVKWFKFLSERNGQGITFIVLVNQPGSSPTSTMQWPGLTTWFSRARLFI